MRKNLVITFLGTLSICMVISQELKTMKSYHSSVSDIVYAIGDTLTIGSHLNSLEEQKMEGYSAIYGKNDEGDYHPITSDLNREKALIVSMYPNDKYLNAVFRGRTVFLLRLLNGLQVYVAIDDAIKEKEIVVFENDDYLNGFKMLDEKIKADLSSINSNDTLYIVLPVFLKEYNIEKNVFPVAYTETGYSRKAPGLVFLNFDDFSAIPISKERAAFFNAANELTPMGTRSAYVAVLFVINNIEIVEQISTDLENNNEKTESNLVYHVTIKGMHCIDSPNLYYNYLGATWK
jgi:hypothetical protein